MQDSEIKLVVFDMDGVLCYLDDERRLDFLVEFSGKAREEIRDAIWGSGFENRSDAGEIDADEYLTEFGRRIGRPISHAEWCAYRRSGMTPVGPVLDTVSRVKRKAEVAVLTNNGLQLRRSFPDLFPELIPLFGHHLHTSAEFKVCKPDPQVFREICAFYSTDPRGAIMVDDVAANTEGARAAGMLGIQFLSPLQLAKDLNSSFSD